MMSFWRPKIIEISEQERGIFMAVLVKLQRILDGEDLITQSQVLNSLIQLLKEKDDQQFKKLLNSIDMFGGSGAVWEVYIEDNGIAREFELEMIELINLMEQTNLLGRGVKPVRKIFIRNEEKRNRRA
jgi:hypothetical protein